MAVSDILEVNYDEFENTVKELTSLKSKFEKEKNKLKNTNTKLLDESKWKGKSRDKYKEISDAQEKRFKELNEKFEEFATNLKSILDEYKKLEEENSKNVNGEG